MFVDPYIVLTDVVTVDNVVAFFPMKTLDTFSIGTINYLIKADVASYASAFFFLPLWRWDQIRFCLPREDQDVVATKLMRISTLDVASWPGIPLDCRLAAQLFAVLSTDEYQGQMIAFPLNLTEAGACDVIFRENCRNSPCEPIFMWISVNGKSRDDTLPVLMNNAGQWVVKKSTKFYGMYKEGWLEFDSYEEAHEKYINNTIACVDAMLIDNPMLGFVKCSLHTGRFSVERQDLSTIFGLPARSKEEMLVVDISQLSVLEFPAYLEPFDLLSDKKKQILLQDAMFGKNVAQDLRQPGWKRKPPMKSPSKIKTTYKIKQPQRRGCAHSV